MLERTEGDETGFFPKGGGVKVGTEFSGIDTHAPANFVGHPVADAGAGVLVEEERFEGLARVPFDEFANVGEGKFGILGLGRKFCPRICAIMEHDATEHTVVIEDECRLSGSDNEVVVLLVFVIGRRGRELAGHPEVDFEMKLRRESEEHTLAVGF